MRLEFRNGSGAHLCLLKGFWTWALITVALLAVAKGQQQPKELVVKAYATGADYIRQLAWAAYHARGENELRIPPPEPGSGLSWNPSPRKLLADLGMVMEPEVLIAYHASEKRVYVRAKPAWHEKLLELHDRLKIGLREVAIGSEKKGAANFDGSSQPQEPFSPANGIQRGDVSR